MAVWLGRAPTNSSFGVGDCTLERPDSNRIVPSRTLKMLLSGKKGEEYKEQMIKVYPKLEFELRYIFAPDSIYSGVRG